MNLPHVAARVFGTPLMVARPKLEVILSVLAPRISGKGIEGIVADCEPVPLSSITGERIAVVSVIGTLVSRSSYLDAASGLACYADIGDAISQAMADPSVRGIILDVDSSGGEVGGLFDLVEQIGATKAANQKPLWAVANEGALSAAYAIASTADRLYVTRTGEVGSIGVVALHVDESGADEQAGLAWSFIFAGERKVDGNAHEPLSERARNTIQADVDRLYAEFCAVVAANRGISSEAARRTNAAIYRGDLAVRAGLADRVGTLDLAIAEMAGEIERSMSVRGSPKFNANRSPSMATNENEQIGDQPVPEQPAQVVTPTPAPENPVVLQVATPNADQPDVAERLRAEFAEVAAVAAQAARLGVAVDAADAVRKGISAETLRRTVLESLASRAEASTVIAAAPATTSTGESPIVRRAKDRAAATARI